WLQSYLDFSENRATWAYVADALIAHHIPKSEMNIENRDKINIFLQSWRTDKSKLPTDLQNLLTVAEKYGVRMEGLAFSRDIIRQMPIWLHIEAVKLRRLNRSREVECLKSNHNVQTVGDAETIARKLRTTRHTNRSDCKCTACTEIRRTSICKNPGRCF
ncbi:hypothetical protein EV368DRAFT_20285, partial [Lentinula lateritia]